MLDPLLLFRVVLALTAWLAIIYDNYRHRELKFVAYAYTFLVLGVICSAFYGLYTELFPSIAKIFLYSTHLLAVLLAGIMFALTAYASNKHMNLVENKIAKAFKDK